MKKLLIIIDGMEDEPIPEIGNLTPEAYANMPALSFMRCHGSVSYQQTIPSGLSPTTDTALLTILGIPAGESFESRSWFEAIGAGIRVKDGDLCIRCNLITHKDKKVVSHCGFNPGPEESMEIVDKLNRHYGDHMMQFYSLGNFRNILVVRHCSANIVALPPHTLLGQSVDKLKVSSDDPDFENRLNHVVVDAHKVLKVYKSNGIALWAPGRPAHLPISIQGSVVAGANLVKGIGRTLGMKVIDVPGATGDEYTSYTSKLATALESLKKDDFTILHIEAPDEASHQLNWEKKIKILEKIDRDIFQPLLKQSGILQITIQADHGTSSLTGQHLETPVRVVNYIKNE